MKRTALLLLSFAPLAACKGHEFHPPATEERIAEAEAAWAHARFDSIQWDSEAQRTAAGNEVFASRCRRCHGPLGRGDGEYARAEKLRVPSLVEPGWRYAASVDSVRKRVFTGHPPDMKSWGMGGLTTREIDAVAAYVVGDLRAEVAGGS